MRVKYLRITIVEEAGLRLSGIKRRLTGYFSKPKLIAESVELPPEAVSELRFYQFKAATTAFLYDRAGRCDIRVRDTPHFALATAIISGDSNRIETAEAFYRAYLAASWGVERASEFDQRLSEFRSHLAATRIGKKIAPSILTRLIGGDSQFVVDGNHRAAFAAALGTSLEAQIWEPQAAFMTFSKVKEFYGTDNRNMPYQSVFLGGKEVIAGRRNDAIERLSLIPKRVIAGKTVLDVASNVGMSSLIARSMGAKACLGLEVSPGMVSLAMRFAMFDDAYPEVKFHQFDVDSDNLGDDVTFDTAFMFSIHHHLQNPSKLIEIAGKNVERYVVFEGHPNTARGDYADFFESGLFRSVEQIGSLPESIFNSNRNRLLWLCER